MLVLSLCLNTGVLGLSGSVACHWYIDEDFPDVNSFCSNLLKFVFLIFILPICLGYLLPFFLFYSLETKFAPLVSFAPTK